MVVYITVALYVLTVRMITPFIVIVNLVDVYEETVQREQRLRDLGYEVRSIWEHGHRKLKETYEMQQFLDTYDIVTNLEPRDSFFGAGLMGLSYSGTLRKGKKSNMSTTLIAGTTEYFYKI